MDILHHNNIIIHLLILKKNRLNIEYIMRLWFSQLRKGSIKCTLAAQISNMLEIRLTESWIYNQVKDLTPSKVLKYSTKNLDLPGFSESGLSMSRLGQLLSFFGTCGSTRRRLLKLAYLTRKTHYQNARQTQNSSNTQQEILTTRERTD